MERCPSVQHEQDFYNHRWKDFGLTPMERDRIRQTVDAIPPECSRLLDVGSGDGRVCQEAYKRFKAFVLAFDLSPVALSRLALPKCCGSATHLPFPDRSFDLVMATEILEHLPEPAYRAVLDELERVADKYVLITVPNCENLEEVTAACPSCGLRFHAWGHVRQFSAISLRGLFAKFRPIRVLDFGELVPTYNNVLLWLRHRIAGAWYWEDGTICYHCFAAVQPKPRWPFLARVCDALNARVWSPHFQRRGWLLGLWMREAV